MFLKVYSAVLGSRKLVIKKRISLFDVLKSNTIFKLRLVKDTRDGSIEDVELNLVCYS